MPSTSWVETLLSAVHFISFNPCINMKCLITIVACTFSQTCAPNLNNVEGGLSVTVCIMLSYRVCGTPVWSILQRTPERDVGAVHTLSASYLWQVVWHLQSSPAGPPHWQPAAQRGEGSAGVKDTDVLVVLFSKPPFTVLPLLIFLCLSQQSSPVTPAQRLQHLTQKVYFSRLLIECTFLPVYWHLITWLCVCYKLSDLSLFFLFPFSLFHTPWGRRLSRQLFRGACSSLTLHLQTNSGQDRESGMGGWDQRGLQLWRWIALLHAYLYSNRAL